MYPRQNPYLFSEIHDGFSCSCNGSCFGEYTLISIEIL